MTISPIVIGIILCVIGFLALLYAEDLRSKNEIDTNNLILYVGAIGSIVVGICFLIDNL
jgi:divalent metal cation (Fe/Co/Zn/Cd) transporter